MTKDSNGLRFYIRDLQEAARGCPCTGRRSAIRPPDYSGRVRALRVGHHDGALRRPRRQRVHARPFHRRVRTHRS